MDALLWLLDRERERLVAETRFLYRSVIDKIQKPKLSVFNQ